MRKNIIIILDGRKIAEYGTSTTRGRELAERELRSHPGAQAFYDGHEISWVIGKYNDRILDSEHLPTSARAMGLI